VEEDLRPDVDPWWSVFTIVSVGTLGLLLVTDRYVELLAAGAAYAATLIIARADRRPGEEGESP
jgi:hypothetical protein